MTEVDVAKRGYVDVADLEILTPVFRQDQMTAAAGDDGHGMIALVPADDELDRLTVDGGDPREELHVTLAYLGRREDLTDDLIEHADLVAKRAADAVSGIVDGTVAGKGTLGSEEPPATVLFLNGDEIDSMRQKVWLELKDDDRKYAEQHRPYIAHLTVGYGVPVDDVELPEDPIRFDRVRLAVAGDVTDYPLEREALEGAIEEGVMPWTVVEEHEQCTEDAPWGVVNIDTGELIENGCYASQGEAQDRVDELYEQNPEEDRRDDTPLLPNASAILRMFSDGRELSADYWRGFPRVSAEQAERLAEFVVALQEGDAETAPWSGVLAVEGITTGDGREFAPDALEWGELPIPLRWQKEGAHGGEHDVTVTVGLIERIWRDDEKIMGAGHIDLANEDGQEIHRRLESGYPGGVSIDADDISEADIEFVFPEETEGEDDDGDILLLLFGMPEKMIFHAGRIRAATLVDIPAFVEAEIGLISEDEYQSLVSSGTLLGLSLSHFGDTSRSVVDRDWNGSAGRFTDEQYQFAAAACEPAQEGPGNTIKQRCFLPHHEPDGQVNRNGVFAAAQRVNQTERNAESLATAKAHLRAHYRAMDEEIPDSLAAELELSPAEKAFLSGLTDHVEHESIVAAAQALLLPPGSWFRNPELSVPTGVQVTDQGRLYGHAAQWAQCHMGIADDCVTLPHEASHDYFMTGEIETDEGLVAVGQVVLGTGHAAMYKNAASATKHYDDTGYAVADVAVGNDRFGLWVAGAVRPAVDDAKVRELRASGQLSGDWRRVGGKLRLVGLLAVNVPGFPVPRHSAVTSSGRLESMVAAGMVTVSRGTTTLTEDEIERRVQDRLDQRDRKERLAALASRFQG